MYSLFKKELQTFFGSVTGYLVVAIFLLLTGLFLWVLPGGFNIPDGQRASLEGLFNLAPWVYLFLIPAITMRMLAEERRSGTIELLITRPLTISRIVLAKFFAALVLVFVSLLPTLLYFVTVFWLGSPQGNIDMGATWGSFIGLFLLASIYIAIGLWASAISSNQVVSFLVAIFTSFIFYLGFDFAASVRMPHQLQVLLMQLGINEHYLSISRGVADSRDLFYYLAVTLLFLWFTRNAILPGKFKFRISKLVAFMVALAVAYGLINFRLFRLDLTSEKRYSLNNITKKILDEQADYLYVEVYLTGDLPAGMNEFREAIIEKIEDLNAYSPKRIFYRTFDVYSVNPAEKRNKVISELSEMGIQPVNFNHRTNEGLSVKQIFPGVLVQYGNRSMGLDLLRRSQFQGGDENLRQSIELLEYEFARAIRILMKERKPVLAFLRGQGEASEYETGDLRYALSDNYQIMDVFPEELLEHDSIETLLIIDPTERFSNQNKLYIDQFVMRGGKTLWSVDPVHASIDSLSRGYSTIAFANDLNITDLLFKYGIRINPVLLQDVVCAEYPVNTAAAGQQTQFVPAPFYYAPLAQPNPDHPLSRNLNHVLTEFPSAVERVGERGDLFTAPILTTSAYARVVNTPVEVSLLSATMPPDRNLFSSSFVPIGMVAEGIFESLFRNRPTESFGMATTDVLGQSGNNKMVVIADGSIAKNKIKFQGERVQIQPLGFDQYSGQTFGNRDFMVNCVDYLTDKEGILALRTRVVGLRLLDKVLLREYKLAIQLFNVVVPVFIVVFCGFAFQLFRRRKYSKNKQVKG